MRRRLAASVRGLFSHVDRDPLGGTFLYPGDPGLFGPGSATWRVQRHPAVFAAGARALVVQACHPEVLAGVVDHSKYLSDPLGRLSRTSAYVTATAFGATPEVESAVDTVRRAHRWVRGISPRGRPYTADDPLLAAWVHNALVDSFLTCYQVFGPGLSPDDADRYVAEQAQVGAMLGADPLPLSAPDLHAWIADHPDIEGSRDLDQMIEFLRHPPLPPAVLAGYRMLFAGGVSTLPPRLLDLTGLKPRPVARRATHLLVSVLGWALGDSPAYLAALHRSRGARSFSEMPRSSSEPAKRQ